MYKRPKERVYISGLDHNGMAEALKHMGMRVVFGAPDDADNNALFIGPLTKSTDIYGEVNARMLALLRALIRDFCRLYGPQPGTVYPADFGTKNLHDMLFTVAVLDAAYGEDYPAGESRPVPDSAAQSAMATQR